MAGPLIRLRLDLFFGFFRRGALAAGGFSLFPGDYLRRALLLLESRW